MIPAGTALSFRVDGGVTQGWWTSITQAPDEVRSRVIAALVPFVSPMNVTITPTTHISLGITDWNYSAVVTVRTKSDHAKAEDVGSIVAHAFYEAASRMPTVVVTDETPAAAPGGVANPAPSGTGIAAIDDLLAGLKEQLGLKDILQGAQTTLIILGIAAIAIAVVVLKDND